MPHSFEQTYIWKNGLGELENDQHKSPREHLRNAFLQMRENCATLVGMIPNDCKGLTVHDATHLDALWEMADLIVGDQPFLNPAETFVFGAAVLTHDAGMSLAAFPGGLDEIKESSEWHDTVASTLRRRGVQSLESTDLKKNHPEIYDEVIFQVLRLLHAKHAEKLPMIAWHHPATGNEIRLLQDNLLREAYARRIGRIAHSHHWDLSKLEVEFRSNVGAAPGMNFPTDWTLDEVKIACLLRCCDAAHIDQRRAPSMLFSLSRPTGYSREHWNFQNKLQKPTTNGSVLTYSSGQDFELADANSWWLCYDVIKMIDSELRGCDGLLQDSKRATFAAKRVYGADSPRTLSKHILTNGWMPVDAEIRVSDPIYLAKTLGGRSLYGRDLIAPVREILQNAADAIQARRKLENRNASFGKICILIETDSSGDTWLQIEDNGIGMSEAVLTGPLLDFGKSFWNSTVMHEEFPGLASRIAKPVGKYGIGFFSIFLVGEHLSVVSRKLGAGVDSMKALQFSSISSRPIVRSANLDELSIDASTRVRVKVDKPDLTLGINDNDDEYWS